MKEFEKYYFIKDKELNISSYDLADEAFVLFKELYNTHYGSICEEENLISIHTGGWSENEVLIEELKQTLFWGKYHRISETGGHYYFDIDRDSYKKWIITITKKEQE